MNNAYLRYLQVSCRDEGKLTGGGKIIGAGFLFIEKSPTATQIR